MEGSQNRDETVPYFDGIQVNSIVMDEKLDIKGDTVLNTAVALSTIFQKNDMIPDRSSLTAAILSASSMGI